MRYSGLIWDLDGVVTDTSELHRSAWIEALQLYRPSNDLDHESFKNYFNGVPRSVGIRRYLQASPTPDVLEMPDIEKLVIEIGKTKNSIFQTYLRSTSITVFPDALKLLNLSGELGFKNGLASQSENADAVLLNAGITMLFSSWATGITARESSVASKPDPDFYRHASQLLGIPLTSCIVFEDTYAGALSAVTAGAGLCVGVSRNSTSYNELLSAGCDIVCRDLNPITSLLAGN